jgi:hypothetical protein
MAGNSEDLGFDLTAAGLRADGADVAGLVEVLASRLEGALPSLCVVERRRRGVLSRHTEVAHVAVQLGHRRFLLHWDRRELVAEVESTVHDMRRTTDEVPLGVWLAALDAELREHAASNAEARVALERLLDS